MRIYVGTYHKYNSGSIEGAWLDLDNYSSADEFYEACKELHSDEEDPELMYQDWEGIPERLADECMDIREIYEYREMLERVSDAEAFEAFVGYYGTADVRAFEDSYMGEWDSEQAFAENIMEDCYSDVLKAMGSLSYYFDYEAFARDLFMGDYTYESGYVFRCV